MIKEDIDVVNLIKNNNFHKYLPFIKNYEDTLQKMFKNHNNSYLIKDPYIFLWQIDKTHNSDLFEFIDFNPKDFGLPDIMENIVVSGPHIRTCLINNMRKNENTTTRKELYFYCYGDNKWENMVNLENYIDKENEYVLETDDKKIYLIKKKYISPSHVILQFNYIKRIGWVNGSFYVSSMFLFEFQKHKELIVSNFKDPILDVPYDPLNIYCITTKDINDPLEIIVSADVDSLDKLNKKNILKLYDSKTLIEHCIDRYIIETQHIVKINLEKMIRRLATYQFKRHPCYYAKLQNLDKDNNELYQYICSLNNIDEETNIKLENMDDINNTILCHYIKTDLADDFFGFIAFSKIKINKHIISQLVAYKPQNILKQIILNKKTDEYIKYYLILVAENTDIIKDIDFNIEIAFNYLKDIVKNGAYSAFVYLFDHDNSILIHMFEDKKNILHLITTNGQFSKIIDKIMDVKPELINLCDDLGDTPIIYHAKYNPRIIEYMIDCSAKDQIDLTTTDIYGNTCLHYICKQNETQILKKILTRYGDLINLPNSMHEYPAMICCQNKQEEMFYILKSFNADLSAQDQYGNTAYHYICVNSICLGTEIQNIPNYFGLTPKDYCYLSPNYYSFIEPRISNYTFFGEK